MYGVKDWEKSKKRFEAWWAGEVVDRVLFQIYVSDPADASSNPPPRAESLEQMYLDTDYRLRRFEWQMGRTYYAGDAFPYLETSLGPGTLSTYLGARPHFTENTVWYEPCVKDIPAARPPVFNEENPYWQATLKLCREGAKRLKGRALVGFPDLIENLDTLSSLFGNEELLMALVDQPAKVHEFQKAVAPLYLRYYNRLYEIIKDETGGSCFSHFSVYGPGRVAKLQNDFSAMISPRMYEEFAVPYYLEQCRGLDNVLYHWDGPGALPHEKALFAMKEIKVIQWTPGAGRPAPADPSWWPMLHRARAAGKSLWLTVTPAEARAAVEEFGPEGLNLISWTSSKEEADDLVKQSYTWRKRG